MPDFDHPLRYATVNELHARPFSGAGGAVDGALCGDQGAGAGA